MQLRDIMSRFEAHMNHELLPTALVVTDKQIGPDFKVINYLQPESGSELEVHMSSTTGHCELAVLHLYGYGKGIDLV